MPLYEFRSVDGETIERYYPLSKRPQWVVVKGKRFRRLAVPTRIAVRVRQERRFESVQLSKGFPGADGYSPNGKPRYWRESTVDDIEFRSGGLVKFDRDAFEDGAKADDA